MRCVAGDFVAIDVLVNEGAAFGDGGVEVEDRCKGFDVEHDGIERLACHLFADCGNCGHDLTLEANRVGGEQCAIGEAVAVTHVGYVGGGQDSKDTGDGSSGFDVEVGDPSVADSAVLELRDELARKGHVGGVSTRPGDLVWPVGSDEFGKISKRHSGPLYKELNVRSASHTSPPETPLRSCQNPTDLW